MSKHYVDKSQPNLGAYEVLAGPNGWYWQWREVAKGREYIDDGSPYATAADAYRDAARDWESNGNSANRRLAGQLRAAATRAEKSAHG